MNDSPVGCQNRDLARPAGRVESPILLKFHSPKIVETILQIYKYYVIIIA